MSSLVEDLRDLATLAHADVSVAEEAADEIERLRNALATYACRCGDGECYKDEFVASCGRSARVALEEEGKR